MARTKQTVRASTIPYRNRTKADSIQELQAANLAAFHAKRLRMLDSIRQGAAKTIQSAYRMAKNKRLASKTRKSLLAAAKKIGNFLKKKMAKKHFIKSGFEYVTDVDTGAVTVIPVTTRELPKVGR